MGWELTLWGSAVDPTKARPYVLQDTEFKPFPPPEPVHEPEPETTSASTTKSYLKPTVVHTATTSADGSEFTTTMGVVPIEDAITHESDLSDPRFIAAIAGFVSFFALAGVGIYLIMRRSNLSQSGEYSTVPGSAEEAGVPLMATREGDRRASRVDVIYDEDEENERQRHDISSNPTAFHSGFLDDDEGVTEGTTRLYGGDHETRT